LKKEIEVLEKVLFLPSDKKMGRPRGSIAYSDEQIKFLKKCAKKNLEQKAIVNEFNKEFGTRFPINSRALYNFMDRQGMITIEKREFEDEK